MSDLQCPARFLVVPLLGSTGGAGRTEGTGGSRTWAATWADELRVENVAAVYAGDGSPAAPAGVALAAALRIPLGVLPTAVGGRPVPSDAAARFRAALEDLADRHRGETVVVLTDAPHGLPQQQSLVVVDVDADGWRVSTSPLSNGPGRGSDSGQNRREPTSSMPRRAS